MPTTPHIVIESTDPEQSRVSLRRLERRDWFLWVSTIVVLVLMGVAAITLTLPTLFGIRDIDLINELQLGARGLFGLVVLFSVFALYQQVLIKRLRHRLAEQISLMAALQTRAELLEQLAVVDPLTGLFNRRFAYQHLPAEMGRAERQRFPLTLLLLDLNDFKQVNDTHGHATGDAALREFARALKKTVRSSDTPVRMGGDEFMVVLPECSSYAVPHALARLREATAQCPVPLTFSAGWAEHEKGETAEELVARADRALYQDKATGAAVEQVNKAAASKEQKQRMEIVGSMTGRLVHDFNNLLAVIKGHGELALSELGAEHPTRQRLEHIEKASREAVQLSRQVLAFASHLSVTTQVVNLNDKIEEMVPLITPLLTHRIALVIQKGTDLPSVRVQSAQMEQIVMHLVANARDAMRGGGTCTIATEARALGEEFVRAHPGSRSGYYAVLIVSDTGKGMDEATRKRVFDPYFTTKKDSSGLGLSMVYGAVKQMGGYIGVESTVDKGSTFALYIPRFISEAVAAPATLAAEAEKERVVRTVLVVETTAALRSMFSGLLRMLGYSTLEAKDALEAVQISDQHEGAIDVVLTETVLPGMSARELAAAMEDRRPACAFLYICGSAEQRLAVLDLPEHSVITPPFEAHELQAKIEALCQRKAMLRAVMA